MIDRSDPRLDNMTVTITDIRRAGICVAGTKGWFETHNLDFRSLIKQGIPAKDLLATNDGYADLVVEKMLERG